MHTSTPSVSAKKKSKGNGLIKALLIGFVLLVLTTAIVIAFFGPAIASILARGVIEDTVNEQIAGSVEIEKVSLSWKGPQRITGLTVLSADGDTLGTFEGSAAAGLLDLASGDLDLGEVVLTRTNAEAIDPRTAQEFAAAFASTAPPTGEPVAVPETLRATLNVSLGDLGIEGETIGDLRVDARVEPGAPTTFSLRAGNGAISLDASSPNLIGADGVVNFDGSGAQVALNADAPASLLAALMGEGTPADASLHASFDLVEQDGVLVPKPGTDISLYGRLPSDALRRVVGAFGLDPDSVTSDDSPAFALRVPEFALPLPGPGGAMDWRGARLRATVQADPINGVAVVQDGRRAPFSTDPLRGELSYDASADAINISASTGASFDGESTGRFELNASATDLLDDGGAIRSGGPSRMQSEIGLVDVPGALFRKVAVLNGTLQDIVGDRVTARLTGTINDQDTTLNGAKIPTGQPAFAIDIRGENASVNAHLIYDGARGVRTVGDQGMVIRSERGASLALALLGDTAPAEILDEGVTEFVLTDGVVMLNDDMTGVDTRSLAGDATLTLEPIRVALASGEPIDVTSSSVGLKIDAGDIAWSLDTQMRVLGEDAGATGSGTIDNALLGGATVAGVLDVENLPTALASAFSQALGDAALESVGPSISGRLSTSDDDPGRIGVDLAGAYGSMTGAARVADGSLVIEEDAPLRLSTRRAGVALSSLLNDALDQRLRLESDASAEIVVTSARIDLGADRSLGLLRGVTLDGYVMTDNLRGTLDRQTLALDNARFGYAVTPDGDAVMSIDTTGAFAGERMVMAGELSVLDLHDGSGLPDLANATLGADVTGTIPTEIAALLPSEDLRAALREVAGDGMLTIALTTSEQAARGLGGIAINASSSATDLTLDALVGPDRRGLVVGDVTLRGTFTPELFARFASPMLAETEYAGVRLKRAVKGNVYVPSFAMPLRNRMIPDFANIPNYVVRLRFDEDVFLTGVPSPVGDAVVEAGVRNLDARYTHNASFRNLAPVVGVSGLVFKPGTEYQKAAIAINANSELPVTRYIGEARVLGDLAHLDDLLRTDGYFREMLGESFTLNLRGRGVRADGEKGESPYELDFQSRRLVANLGLWRTNDGGFVARERAFVGWYLTPERATAMLLNQGERDTGLRIDQTLRMDLSLNTLRLGPVEQPFLKGSFGFEGQFQTTRIVIADRAGETEDLGYYVGNATTLGDGTIDFELIGEREATGPMPDGQNATERTLTASGRVSGYADALGRPSLATTKVAPLNIDGAVPTRLVDALGGTDGLASALVGPTTNVNATIGEDSASGIEAGFVGAFARGAMTGSISDGALTIDKDSDIVVGQISNEASRRLFGTAFPMFTSFEKSARDTPASITTTGLTLPLDGDIAKLDGTLRVDLGTMRFATKPVFGRLLELIDGRAQGQLGRRLKPFELRVDQGVIRYEEVMLPLGDFEVMVDGRVNLKSRRVNTLVWVPFSAISDDLARSVSRIPGADRIAMVPLRVRGPLDEPGVDLDPEALIEEVPNALLGPLFNDLFNNDDNDGRDRD